MGSLWAPVGATDWQSPEDPAYDPEPDEALGRRDLSHLFTWEVDDNLSLRVELDITHTYTGDLEIVLVPENEVLVIMIEMIQIAAPAGSLANRSKT